MCESSRGGSCSFRIAARHRLQTSASKTAPTDRFSLPGLKTDVPSKRPIDCEDLPKPRRDSHSETTKQKHHQLDVVRTTPHQFQPSFEALLRLISAHDKGTINVPATRRGKFWAWLASPDEVEDLSWVLWGVELSGGVCSFGTTMPKDNMTVVDNDATRKVESFIRCPR